MHLNEANVRNFDLLKNDATFKLDSWMSKMTSSIHFTNINYPGTFNSLSFETSTLYSGNQEQAVNLFIQHQEKTILEQLNMGVRAFDFKVNYYSVQEQNKTEFYKYHYCNPDTLKCSNLIAYYDVFPLSGESIQK